MNTAASASSSFGNFKPLKLFPTIDRSFLSNDSYHEEDSYLDIDYQEADYGNDLDLASPNCDKSSQHDDFIDIDDFDMESLPSAIQHPSVVVWIRNYAPLVVRLSHKANATGRVFVIRDHVKRKSSCTNKKCVHSFTHGDDHSVYGGLGIITNKHVVKSDLEAQETKVEFFYHNDNRDFVIKEYGQTVHMTNSNLDYTMFTCIMHDPDLLKCINLFTEISTFAWRCIPETIRRELKKFAIVISHPHGTPKKISIGKVIGSELRNDSKSSLKNLNLLRDLYLLCEKNKSWKRFSVYLSLIKDLAMTMTVKVTYYDAATCPGSSGAPVSMGNAYLEDGLEVNPPHTHRGRHPINGYNNCYT